MASSKQYLEFILDQLSDLDGVSYRAMMGEYVIYYKEKVIGGIYDDRFLVKQTPAARALMPSSPLEMPYEGGRPMLLVENIDDREFLRALFGAMLRDLPSPKKKNRAPGGTAF